MNNYECKIPKLGDVYMINFDGDGNEQCGYRPCVVVQNNTGNVYSPNVIVLPLTSRIKKSNQLTHVVIKSENSGLMKDSMVLCENPKTISKARLYKYITTLSDDYISMIAEAYLLATSLVSFIDPSVLQIIWENAYSLNNR